MPVKAGLYVDMHLYSPCALFSYFCPQRLINAIDL